MKEAIPGLAELIEQPVQSLPPGQFAQLESGDILFIDSSHVCKTASDVQHLCSHVLPLLAAGVYIHFHDVFLPQDYPKQWVLKENRSWNEQYVLQAILANSGRYKIIFGSNYACLRHQKALIEALGSDPEKLPGGCSFWIRKVS